MKRASLEIEFVTPCFLAGADQTAAAEWRAASIRGQLRWWFRAVAGGELGGDLAKTRAAESEIFGSTDRRSAVRVRTLAHPPSVEAGKRFEHRQAMRAEDLATAWGLTPENPLWKSTCRRLTIRARNGEAVPTDPFQYLGFGCIDRGRLTHPMIPAGESARFEIVWQGREWQRVAPGSRELLVKAVWAWLHLGGIGAKSRNGFGSLRCLRADGDWETLSDGPPELLPGNVEALKAGLQATLQSARSNRSQAAEWTHFSQHARVFLGTEVSDSWQASLARAGAWLMAFRRRYGADYDDRRYEGRGIGGRDYEWGLHHHRRRTPPAQFPDRTGFGLPLPFGKDAETVLWDERKKSGPPADTRRASPLLLHVSHVGGRFFPVLTYLPARPVPRNGELRLKGRTGPRVQPTPEQGSVITWFLDDLRSKDLVQEVTP